MKRQIISSTQATNPPGGYSPAIAVEGAQRLTFFSALSSPATGGMDEESRGVVEQLKALLDAAGLTSDNLVRLDIFLLDIRVLPEVELALKRIVAKPPTLTVVEVSAVAGGGRVAIQAIAAS
jgi:2-iminobutanoate/2-iminopropanoate deaminase